MPRRHLAQIDSNRLEEIPAKSITTLSVIHPHYMPRPKHYSPQISRFIVSVLYHEAKARQIPMTKLTDDLLRQALTDSHGWRQAESLTIAESPPIYPAPPDVA